MRSLGQCVPCWPQRRPGDAHPSPPATASAHNQPSAMAPWGLGACRPPVIVMVLVVVVAVLGSAGLATKRHHLAARIAASQAGGAGNGVAEGCASWLGGPSGRSPWSGKRPLMTWRVTRGWWRWGQVAATLHTNAFQQPLPPPDLSPKPPGRPGQGVHPSRQPCQRPPPAAVPGRHVGTCHHPPHYAALHLVG